VIDPILKVCCHEAFGHLSEADMAYENPDLLEVMSIGRQFGPPELQIFDGAAPPHPEPKGGQKGGGIVAATSTTTKAHQQPPLS
jgi:TldD protein